MQPSSRSMRSPFGQCDDRGKRRRAIRGGLADVREGPRRHPAVRRELASAAIRLADKHDVTPLLRALMAHKEDAKDPVIPQLVWLAYEKVLANAGRKPGEVRKTRR